VTQVELARRLEVSQATVSKFEKSNPAVSTVRRYVEALGGRLEMTAVFDDSRMIIEN
jgi:predicted transcriptional regulator